MGKELRALGIVGLLVASAGQPTLTEATDRGRHPAAHQEDIGAEAPWRLPIDGIVDISEQLPGPVSGLGAGVPRSLIESGSRPWITCSPQGCCKLTS